jgi:Uma2 family endonuclease
MQTLYEVEDSLKWYYELYPEELDMSESLQHRDINDYLRQVLLWYYRFEKHLILANQLIFQPGIHTSPDIAVIKNVTLPKNRKIVSWKVNPPSRPAPSVTLEISSESNWDKDIEADKLPKQYAELGVKEYFAYDPEGFWGEAGRLKGWRNENGVLHPLVVQNERVWSNELNCWVACNDDWLWFEDRSGKRLLTEAEAQREQLAAEAEAREIERQKAEIERQRAELEKQRAEAESYKAEVERQRAEFEKQKAEKMAEKLRELNIDPDKL